MGSIELGICRAVASAVLVTWMIGGCGSSPGADDVEPGGTAGEGGQTEALPGGDPVDASMDLAGGPIDPDAGLLDGPAVAPTVDPGAGAWQPVAPQDVEEVCGLDPAMLAAADQKLGQPWAIVRYGRLCHEYRSADMLPAEAWSATKTLGAVVTGMVAHETRELPETAPGTGPLSDMDRVDRWLPLTSYHRDARIAHVLAMVAHNPSLAPGDKTMSYDTVGSVQINSLSDVLGAAIAQDSGRLGADLEQFTQRFLFGPLGMHESTWTGGAPDKTFAFSWSTTTRDMARLGLLVLNGGVWSGQRLLGEEWVHRMTHPAFEDGNTGYGYLTWLNASSNHHFGGIPGTPIGRVQRPMSPGPCAPVALHDSYPHDPSGAPDCGYDAPHTCEQRYDVGVWNAVGLGGEVIQGHPGLQIVLVGRDLDPVVFGTAGPATIWDAVAPAVIAGDPTYAGDEAGFCEAYGSNAYAPDLR